MARSESLPQTGTSRGAWALEMPRRTWPVLRLWLASALSGVISGTGVYEAPANYSGVGFWLRHGFTRDHGKRARQRSGAARGVIDRVESSVVDDASTTTTRILPGFPEKISGEIVFCDADNLDTDNIYPGKYTYQDDITKEGMASVCMSNYDPDFGSVVKPNDILVSGFNFGCGSSREQAATAILAKQIPLVVAGQLRKHLLPQQHQQRALGLGSPAPH